LSLYSPSTTEACLAWPAPPGDKSYGGASTGASSLQRGQASAPSPSGIGLCFPEAIKLHGLIIIFFSISDLSFMDLIGDYGSLARKQVNFFL